MSESISNDPTVRTNTVCIGHKRSPEELHDYESFSGGLFVGGIFFISFLIPAVVFGSGAISEAIPPGSNSFLLMCVTTGMISVFCFIYAVLCVFKPVPILTLTPGHPAPGESVTLAWRFHGSPKRLRTLAISVRGIERASIPGIEGDTEYVNTFETFQILSTVNPYEIAGGEVQFTIPEKALPSFYGASNQIMWCLELDASSHLLPDIRATLEFKVAPYSISDAGRVTKGSFDLFTSDT